MNNLRHKDKEYESITLPKDTAIINRTNMFIHTERSRSFIYTDKLNKSARHVSHHYTDPPNRNLDPGSPELCRKVQVYGR